MKFLFVNEGSRGEVDSYVGGLKQLDELIDMYIEDREKLVNEDGCVNEFMEMEFGGISNKDCFVEICFGEEDNYIVYLISDVKYNILDGNS
jgi:hypothetical protein